MLVRAEPRTPPPVFYLLNIITMCFAILRF
jgi:hypothetical protein